MAHCTLITDLTLWEHLHILGERRQGMCKSDIYDTKPCSDTSETKRSRA